MRIRLRENQNHNIIVQAQVCHQWLEIERYPSLEAYTNDDVTGKVRSIGFRGSRDNAQIVENEE